MEILQYPLNLVQLQRKRLQLKKQLAARSDVQWMDKRIAVLGGSTTHDIITYLELFLLNTGIRPEFYESEYGMFFEDAVFGNETLTNFKPDIVLIHTSTDNIRAWPGLDATEEDVNYLLDKTYDSYRTIWESLEEKFGCVVIQNNFEAPFYRLLGNADAYDIHGRTYFVNELNARFARYARSNTYFYLNDINWLSGAVGLDRWANRKHWHMYKSAMDVSLIPLYSMNVSFIIKSIFGFNKKALALDLDNTLWGGVIGDDGQEGIDIGAGSGEGEAYYEFQAYIKQLGQFGILLNVNSKNEEENARLGLEHPAGLLRPDDFICIYANWNNKDENLLAMAKELNIGVDSIVLVDDNPAERDLVKSRLPSVCCPELSDIESYIRVIDRNGYFEGLVVSKDDLLRNKMYQTDIIRKRTESSFTDYNSYLKSLDMRAVIDVPKKSHYQRVTQLINKTNQFNLTTKRYSEVEVANYIQDTNNLSLYGSLKDKYGENGIVSVLMGHREEMVLYIDIFVMSCRVFKRGMEDAMMNAYVNYASRQGIKKIVGIFIPTVKNKIVEKQYQAYGFRQSKELPDGGMEWELDVESYIHKECHILIENMVR